VHARRQALDEERAALRVEACGEELCDERRVRWRSSAGSCSNRDSVQIDHAVEGVVVALQRDPLAHRAG